MKKKRKRHGDIDNGVAADLAGEKCACTAGREVQTSRDIYKSLP